MSATRYKKPHVDILICIEMTRERNLGIKKHPVLTFFLLLKIEFSSGINPVIFGSGG